MRFLSAKSKLFTRIRKKQWRETKKKNEEKKKLNENCFALNCAVCVFYVFPLTPSLCLCHIFPKGKRTAENHFRFVFSQSKKVEKRRKNKSCQSETTGKSCDSRKRSHEIHQMLFLTTSDVSTDVKPSNNL